MMTCLHPTDGPSRQGTAVLQPEFGPDVETVHVHCFRTDVQFGGNVIGAQTFADFLEDLKLPIRQGMNFLVGPPFAASRKGAHHHVGDDGTDGNPSGGDLPQGSFQFLVGGVLHDVTFRSGIQGAERVEFLVVHRQHQQRDVGVRDRQVFDQFQTGAIGKRDVHNHQVRTILLDQSDGFPARGGLPDARKAIQAVHKQPNSLPHEGVVVHDGDLADRLDWRLVHGYINLGGWAGEFHKPRLFRRGVGEKV